MAHGRNHPYSRKELSRKCAHCSRVFGAHRNTDFRCPGRGRHPNIFFGQCAVDAYFSERATPFELAKPPSCPKTEPEALKR